MGKSTISMAIFNSWLLVHQRVNSIRLLNGWMEWPVVTFGPTWMLWIQPAARSASQALTSGKRCTSCRESESVKTQSLNMALSGRIPWKKSGFRLIQVWETPTSLTSWTFSTGIAVRCSHQTTRISNLSRSPHFSGSVHSKDGTKSGWWEFTGSARFTTPINPTTA